MVFSSLDGSVCVLVLPEAQMLIEKEVKLRHPYETGGILIGKYDENLRLATVYTATRPPKDSKHNPTTFQRGIGGLNDEIKLAQKKYRPSYTT